MPVTPERLLRPEILSLAAYHVADSAGMIKLDAMENPYPWPGELTDRLLQRLRDVQVNRYPDPHALRLKERLREVMLVPQGAELLIGNGSDELIQILAMATAKPNAVIMAPEPSFAMYSMIASFVGMSFQGVPLTEHFQLDREVMKAAIATHRPALIFLAYPNNPTGNLFDPEVLREIIDISEGLVVIDEAYFAFADATFLSEVLSFPNLLVMRTLSKTGLAGLRVGFLVGSPTWIRHLEKLRLPYNVGAMTQVSAEFALDNQCILDERCALIRSERARLHHRLADLPEIEVNPSAANFFLLRFPRARAGELFEGLKAEGILVKAFLHSSAPLADCLRVTVGTPGENDAFVEALHKLL